MAKRVEVIGERELLAKLRGLSAAVRGAHLQAAVRAGALLIENSAKGKAPYRTGTLRRSIHTEVEGDDSRATATIGTDVVYAAQVEFGGTIKPKNAKMLHWVDAGGQDHFAFAVTQPARPYLRPAFDEEQGNAENEIKAALAELLNGVAG